MLKTVLAAALVAAALQGVREERVLERTGLVGSCSAVTASPSDPGGWMACRSGRLSGYPDLSRDSCKLGGTRASIVYWRCPADPVASRAAATQVGTAQSP
jgi:hypothetical protein